MPNSTPSDSGPVRQDVCEPRQSSRLSKQFIYPQLLHLARSPAVTLQRGLGSDTYVFNPGDGQDTIFDNGTGNGGINTLQFRVGIASGQVSVKE